MKSRSALILTVLLISTFLGSITFANSITRKENSAASTIMMTAPRLIIVPDNYPSIQAAVYAANPGDQIMVRNGTYIEHVTVNQTVSIFAQYKHGAIVDGLNGGTVFTVMADDVRISNFTIRNSGAYTGRAGIYLNSVDGCYIRNNVLRQNLYGILVSSSNNNYVLDNYLSSNLWTGSYEMAVGIYLQSAINNFVIGNNASVNIGDGIGLINSNFSVVTSNFVIANGFLGPSHAGFGIRALYSNHNTITSNNVTENQYGGIYLYSSNNNIFHHNNVVDNGKFGNNAQAWNGYNSANTWDDSYPSGGNYWSDYTTRYPNAQPRPDGKIWDTPYVLDANNIDRYPLINPYIPLPTIATKILFTLSPNPAIFGQSVTLLGNLATKTNSPISGAKVTVKSNGTAVATLTTNSTGWFKITGATWFKPSTITAYAGTFNITVSYAGSIQYLPSSYWKILTVKKATTEIYAKFSVNPVAPGANSTLKGTLVTQFSNPIKYAKVTLQYSKDYGLTWTTITTLTTSSYGTFSKIFTAPSAGTYIYRMKYAGSPDYLSSTTDIPLIVR